MPSLVKYGISAPRAGIMESPLVKKMLLGLEISRVSETSATEGAKLSEASDSAHAMFLERGHFKL